MTFLRSCAALLTTSLALAFAPCVSGCAADASEDGADENAAAESGEDRVDGDDGVLAVATAEGALSKDCKLSVAPPYASRNGARARIGLGGCGSVTVHLGIYVGGEFAYMKRVTANTSFVTSFTPDEGKCINSAGQGTLKPVQVVAFIGDPRSPARRASNTASLHVTACG